MEIFTILCLLTLNYFAADAYIRVERAANCPKITDFPGRVKYRRRGTRAVFKCPKKFDRHGPKFATCQKDGTWSNDPPLCIKTGCVPLDPSQVTKLDMEVVNGAFVQFSCLYGYVLIGATQAYCDGKDWSAPLPRCATLHELTECDFEEDLCGWTQDDDEEQDWTRQMGQTQTGSTGPKHDHTLGDSGNGHYLYFETSSPTMAGHNANLLSPVYTADLSPMCFDFWYHILGPEESGHVGSLEVFILDKSQFIDDDDVQPVFVKKGNQGDMWHRGDIFIDTQPESYQIAIVATNALSNISDIAFDDVRLYNCSQSTTTTSTTATTTSTTTSAGNTTTVEKTVTSSARPVTTKTTITTKTESPTTTTIKTETITESPTSTTKSTIITESPTPAVTKTSTFKSSSSTAKPTRVSTPKQTVQPTMKPTGTTSNTSPNTNTWSSVFTKTTIITPKSTKFSTKNTTAPTESTEKTKTSKQKTSATSRKSTSTTSRTITTAPPVSSQTSSKSTVTTSLKVYTATSKSEYKSTVKSTRQATSGPTTIYTKTKTFSERTTESPVKTDTFTRDPTTSSTFSSVATTSLSSFSSSSYSTSSSSSSRSFSSSSSYSTSSESKTGGTKPQTTPSNSNTKTKVSKDSSEATKTVKPTKRTNDLTTKSPKSSTTSIDNTISVYSGRSKHPEDDTLIPLMIGLCVGIWAGLIIIVLITYVRDRRRTIQNEYRQE